MQKVIAISLLLCLCCFPIGLAEIPCECQQDHCTCFIQFGDGGPALEYIQHALILQGYLHQSEDASLFDDNTLHAVLRFQEANQLPPTGTLTDATLTLLLWGLLPEELDEAEPLSNDRAIWIPTDGGIRRHKKPDCCKMLDPRCVSVRNADLMNFQPCGICNRGGKNE